MSNLHLINSPKVLVSGGLQMISFALTCGSIKRKCVRMIQPINALTPRAVFRGKDGTCEKTFKGQTKPTALGNAAGIAAATGGVTTLFARSYTPSWAHAGILGVCGAFLALFFMTPQLIEKSALNKYAQKSETEIIAKEEGAKVAEVANMLKPAKKLIQFKQQA